MKYINNKELKILHGVEVEILKEVDAFCKKNQITYFLYGGTLLGSIRHKGFIPWDDDIDIGMPRNDYEKFLQLFPHEKTNKYYVQALETDINYWNGFAKVRKSNTLLLEERIKDLKINKEISIDIFPFDSVKGNSYDDIKIRSNLIRILKDTINYKRGTRKFKECHYKYIVFFMRVFSVKFLYKLEYKLMTKDRYKETSHLVSFTSEFPTRIEYYPTAAVLPVQKGNFENLKFNIVNDYDTFLTINYGNYMELPPKEKRVCHKILKIDTEKGEEDE